MFFLLILICLSLTLSICLYLSLSNTHTLSLSQGQTWEEWEDERDPSKLLSSTSLSAGKRGIDEIPHAQSPLITSYLLSHPLLSRLFSLCSVTPLLLPPLLFFPKLITSLFSLLQRW